MKVCIPPALAERLKALTFTATTKERNVILREFLDEDTASAVNKAYEHSLLLKKQEVAFENFVKTVTGANAKQKVEISKRFAKELQRKRELMYLSDGTIDPNFEAIAGRSFKEMEEHLSKIIKTKYGVGITSEQTKSVLESKNKILTAEKNFIDTPSNRLKVGEAKFIYSKVLEDIAEPTTKMTFRETTSFYKAGVSREFSTAQGVLEKSKVVANELTSIIFSKAYKSLKSAWDMSGTANQGVTMFLDDPKIYWYSVKKSFSSLSGLGNGKHLDAFQVEVMGNPLYDEMIDVGIDIGAKTEFFPTAIQEKIGLGVGRGYKATSEAFTLMVENFRVEKYLWFRKEWIKNFPDYANKESPNYLSKEVKEQMADAANSISGRGGYGKLEVAVPYLNYILFAS